MHEIKDAFGKAPESFHHHVAGCLNALAQTRRKTCRCRLRTALIVGVAVLAIACITILLSNHLVESDAKSIYAATPQPHATHTAAAAVSLPKEESPASRPSRHSDVNYVFTRHGIQQDMPRVATRYWAAH